MSGSNAEENPAGQRPLEKHYRVNEIAVMWAFSPNTVRRLFRDEPDVLTIERPETRNKRKYDTMRIPESTLRRVEARLRANGKLRKPPGRARW